MSYSTVNTDFLKRAGNYNVGKDMVGEEITLTRYFDCTVDTLTTSLFYKIFSVEAGFIITEAYVADVTAEGATGTIDIVDDDSATTVFVNDANCNSANAVGATNARKYYAAAGFIVIRPNNTLDAAKFYVVVKGIKLNTNM